MKQRKKKKMKETERKEKTMVLGPGPQEFEKYFFSCLSIHMLPKSSHNTGPIIRQ